MTPHPTPSSLAREAYPNERMPNGNPATTTRAVYASGIAAERARIVAWLYESADDMVDDTEGACERRAIAASLEGK